MSNFKCLSVTLVVYLSSTQCNLSGLNSSTHDTFAICLYLYLTHLVLIPVQTIRTCPDGLHTTETDTTSNNIQLPEMWLNQTDTASLYRIHHPS